MSWSILLAIAGVVGTLCFGTASLVQARKISRLEFQRVRFFWADLETAAREIAAAIRKTGYQPDLIFSPSPRAATVAYLVMYQIGPELPLYIGIIESTSGPSLRCEPINHTMIDTIKWHVYIPDAIVGHNDKKLLIIDDLTMTGTTLGAMVKYFKEMGFSDIKTAAPVVTTGAVKGRTAPDYYWREIDQPDFYFPWGKAL